MTRKSIECSVYPTTDKIYKVYLDSSWPIDDNYQRVVSVYQRKGCEPNCLVLPPRDESSLMVTTLGQG